MLKVALEVASRRSAQRGGNPNPTLRAVRLSEVMLWSHNAKRVSRLRVTWVATS